MPEIRRKRNKSTFRRNIGISNEIPAQKVAPQHNHIVGVSDNAHTCKQRLHASSNNDLRKRAGGEVNGHVVDLEEQETSLTYGCQPMDVEQASMVNQWGK